MRTSTSQIATSLSVSIVALLLLGNFYAAHAARIKSCMRVVPSGELVTRYGA